MTFLRRLAIERPFYRIERQNGSLNFLTVGIPGHRDICPFLCR